MSSDAPVVDVAPSEWHSVRPWSARLSLSVREITSVSVTFILSSTFSDFGVPDLSLESLGLTPEDEDGDGAADDGENSAVADGNGRAIISDALAKGLSVNVNGNPWSKVIFHIDDKMDEAIIIIYALMPGRQYDIDLGLVHGGQSMRRQVVTGTQEPAELAHAPSPEASLPTPSTPTNQSTQPYSSITVEERLAQLQHNLASLNSEHEALTATLKASRRDSQKADAALRTEIEILKRASEKNNVVLEPRARQKVLALQEAVKRTQAATADVQERLKEAEESLPGLREQRASKEAEYAKVKELAERTRQELERVNELEKKKTDSLKSELASLCNKMDKLSGKKEKLETNVDDLEAQLKEVEREIEKMEMDAYAQVRNSFEEEEVLSTSTRENWGNKQQSPGVIGRPPQTTGQRHAWTPSRQSRRQSVNSNNHNPIAQSSSTRSTPGNPSHHQHNRPSHRRSHSGSSSSHIPPTGASIGSSPTQFSSPPMSTLSSKAPPFEPGRFIRSMTMPTNATNYSYPNSSPSPIQRPARNSQHGSKDSLLSR